MDKIRAERVAAMKDSKKKHNPGYFSSSQSRKRAVSSSPLLSGSSKKAYEVVTESAPTTHPSLIADVPSEHLHIVETVKVIDLSPDATQATIKATDSPLAPVTLRGSRFFISSRISTNCSGPLFCYFRSTMAQAIFREDGSSRESSTCASPQTY